MPSTALRVTVADVRAARYCLAGVRPWFRRHGLDWQDFLARGIDAAVLRATGDALIEPVIRAAEMRSAQAPAPAAVPCSPPVTNVAEAPTPKEPPDGRA